MKIVFLGTPDFAVASLKALLNAGYDVAAVVTAPDRPAGRGRKLQFSAVKDFALANGIKILQPTNLKDPLFLNELKDLKADIQVVVAFRMLPQAVWDMPALGTFNVHASLLPKYRGAAPINRAIMNGEKETGVTVFKLRHEVDTGNILLQAPEQIGPDTTAGELYERLKHKGAALLLDALNMIEEHAKKGTPLPFRKQDEGFVTHAPKIFREDCLLDFNKSALELHNQVRGLSPVPGAYCYMRNNDGYIEKLKILRSRVSEKRGEGANGLLVADGSGSLKVICCDGSIDILELQLEGKKRMDTPEFLKGYRFSHPVYLSAGTEQGGTKS